MNCQISICQDRIRLKNPSFEDTPRKGIPRYFPITMWEDCGSSQFPSESPPDIHPVINNAWGVSMQPEDGLSYLGLVVRANNTWESVGQQLSKPLRAGVCYTLTAMLALSEKYQSASFATAQEGTYVLENFSNPVMLVIWGGSNECEKLEILAESKDVANHDWMPYELMLSPHNDYTHITIEAFYSKLKGEHYNGHIMVDNLSSVIEVECN